MSTDSTQHTNSSPVDWALQHWRGDLSLGVAYWLTGFVVGLTAKGIGSSAQYLLTDTGPIAALAGVGFFTLWLTLMMVWYLVGVWRSASRHVGRGGKPFWAWTAKGVVIVGAASMLWSLATSTIPSLQALTTNAQTADILPPYTLRLSQDRTAVELSGGLRPGATKALVEVLKDAPTVKQVYLTSRVGWLPEAVEMRTEIQKRKLSTMVEGDCMGACVAAYLGGSTRGLNPIKGRIGFGPWIISSEQDRKWVDEEMRQALLAQVDMAFIRKAYVQTPQTRWEPTVQELVDARFVTDLSAAQFQ